MKADVRVKDIAHVKGIRSNQLIGYGVVIGLQGTGDSAATAITAESMNTMMSKLGVSDAANLPPGSSASVLSLQNFQLFSEIEEKINVKVSILGDATDLSGGQLLMTPLKGLDERVYAVASGDLGRNQNGDPITVTTITNGAQIERSFVTTVVKNGVLSLVLKDHDFTNSTRLVEVINKEFRSYIAEAIDGSKINVNIPPHYENELISFIARIESLKIDLDQKAVIVINQRTGTVVMGKDVVISSVVLSHDGLSVEVGSESPKNVFNVEASTVGQLVKVLNGMGIKPKDLISVVESLYSAGAISAELKYM